MATFPTIRSGQAAMYPLTRFNIPATTEVLSFVGDFEQRFISSTSQNSFQLVYTNINGADLSVIRSFVSGLGGKTSSTFSLVLMINGASVTFNNLVLTSDTMSVSVPGPGKFTVSIACRELKDVTW